MTIVRVVPPADIAGTYTTPGQYVEVRIDGETGYFVLAGPPGANPWELVMRSGGGASDVLLAAHPGRALEITPALGDGFPMDAARGRDVVIALSGTGIAAGRPLVGRRVADGDAARTQVFVGTRTRGELALAGDIDAWTSAGITVVICLSQGTPGDPGEPGEDPRSDRRVALGYVQDVVRARVAPGAWAHVHVFAVGLGSMIEALRSLAPELGLPSERVLTNH